MKFFFLNLWIRFIFHLWMNSLYNLIHHHALLYLLFFMCFTCVWSSIWKTYLSQKSLIKNHIIIYYKQLSYFYHFHNFLLICEIIIINEFLKSLISFWNIIWWEQWCWIKCICSLKTFYHWKSWQILNQSLSIIW